MAKVDVSRFGDKLLKVFAPSILHGQVFIAFVDEDSNSFTIEGDNLSSSSSEPLADSLYELKLSLQQEVSKLQTSITTLQQQPQGVDSQTMNTALDALEDRVQAKLDALQASIPEQQQDSQASGSSITIVDDIVYGYHNFDGDSPHLDFSNKAKLRARPFLYCSGSIYLAAIEYDPSELIYISYGKDLAEDRITTVYAGFEDGKIHTVNEGYDKDDSIVSTPLNNGDFIMNKADNCVYTYDAANHKFIRVGGNQHFVVDYILDYIGVNVPSSLATGKLWAMQLDYAYGLVIFYFDYQINSWPQNTIFPQQGVRIASIQNMFDNAAIYIVMNGEYTGSRGLRAIHDLYDGDTVYNKADGYTYTFSDDGTTKSFIRSSSPVIQPVLDILPFGFSPPDKPSAEGEKFLQFYPPESWRTQLFTATSADSWNEGVEVQIGDRYVSLADHKIYTFVDAHSHWANIDAFHCDAPVGVPFLNRADNCWYMFNGSDFVKINAT